MRTACAICRAWLAKHDAQSSQILYRPCRDAELHLGQLHCILWRRPAPVRVQFMLTAGGVALAALAALRGYMVLSCIVVHCSLIIFRVVAVTVGPAREPWLAWECHSPDVSCG